MYMYIYIHTHTYIHTHIHTYIYTDSPSRRLKVRTYIDYQHSGELPSGEFARGDSPIGRQRYANIC